MDIQSLYYFSEVAKDLHITKTANRLYISQQTLSNHIQRLEEYYGTPLLNRKPNLTLTCAGEHVLAFAEHLNYDERNLKDILADIDGQSRGVINFGASTFRMDACLPKILPTFSQEFPDVQLRLTDNVSDALEPLVIDGILDMAITVGNNSAKSKLNVTPLMRDQIYMCVDDSLLSRFYGSEKEVIKENALKGTNLRVFGRLPFCIQNNRLGNSIRRCFDDVNIIPKNYLTCSFNQITTNVGMVGVAAFFTTQMHLVSIANQIPDSMNIFPVLYHGRPIYQEVNLIQNENRYLSRYSARFNHLLIECFSDLSDVDVSRKAN